MANDKVESFATDEDKVSYGLGWQFGRHLMTHDFKGLDLQKVFTGMSDCYGDKPSPITDEQVEKAFQTIAARVQVARDAEAAELAGKSVEFMAKNALKEGVITTPSGLQYREVEMSEGKKPSPLDSVKVHYHGMLTTGTVFDSSVERGQPTEFPIQDVIPGWTEALQLMPVGSKFRLYIPAKLAYGEKGHPPKIPGNAALIFDVELLDIV